MSMDNPLLGVLDDEFPESLQNISHRDRLEWHCSRIRRHEPVFNFLEQISHEELSDDLLIDDLLRTRFEMKQLRDEIYLRTSRNFSILKTRLAHAVTLMKYSTVDTDWEKYFNKVFEHELEIRNMCEEIQANPLPYLKLHEFPKESLTGRTYTNRKAVMDAAPSGTDKASE